MINTNTTSTVKSVKVNELRDKLGNINLIDIRQPFEYRNAHLPGAKNIPMEEVLNEPEEFLDKSKEYYIICQSGNRSLRACNYLRDKGYKVINVAEGTSGYKGSLEI